MKISQELDIWRGTKFRKCAADKLIFPKKKDKNAFRVS